MCERRRDSRDEKGAREGMLANLFTEIAGMFFVAGN